MWTDLLLAVPMALACLLAPGFLLVRALGIRGEISLCLAPIASIAAYGALSIAYGAVGIPCGLLTLVLPPAVLGAILLALRVRHGDGSSALGIGERLVGQSASPSVGGVRAAATPFRVAMLVAVAAGVVTSTAVYVMSLGDPNSFVQTYDNAWHLTRVHEFAQTSCYSPLVGGFYPSAWHCLAALVESGMGVSTAMAEHAANLAFIVGAYPSSSVLLLAALFPDRPRRVVLGAMLCLIFAFFPWRIMLFGPLYPNLAAFSLMPAEAALFILLLGSGVARGDRIRLVGLFVLGGVAMVLSQPNAIFSTGAFLIPYCVWRMRDFVKERLENRPHASVLSVAAAAGLSAAFIVLWVLLAQAPFMSSVVNYPREPLLGFGAALRWGLGFGFVIRRQQFALTALVALGAFVLLLRPRRRWLTFSFALLMGIYVVAISFEGALQHLIAGFWYSDYYRLAATACVFGVPLAAAGLDAIVSALMWCGHRLGARTRLSWAPRAGAVASVLATVALLALNYVPFEFIDWYYRSYAFDAVAYELRDLYQNEGNWALGSEELAFARRASEAVPEGSRVLNIPFDGSCFTYSACDLDVLYDSYTVDQSQNGVTLRMGIDRVADDALVRDAANALGVDYVLKLDQGTSTDGFDDGASAYLLGYDPKHWVGMTAVDDETPGLECVLSEGDMRLYRIEV